MTARRGYAMYCAVLAAMPGTAEEVAQRTGISQYQVRKTARGMFALRLIHRCGVVEKGKKNTPTSVWAVGNKVSVESPRKADHTRYAKPATLIAFASVVRALNDQPCASTDIVEASGMHMRQTLSLLTRMRKIGLIHRCGWEVRSQTPTALYVFGPGNDARRPKPISKKETNRKYWDGRASLRRQMIIQSALAA